MKNVIVWVVVIIVIALSFFVGRWTKPKDQLDIIRYDTLPPIVRIDTVRDTVLVPKYVYVKRFDTIRDTMDGNPIYMPVPISSYLFTDDSTYRIDMEGYNIKARSIEVYPRTVTQTVIERVSVPAKQKRWGIGPQIGFGYNGMNWMPYVGVGIQYNLILF